MVIEPLMPPPPRPPLAVRRLSVQGHTLESVTFEMHQGEARQLEHTREEVRAESIVSTSETSQVNLPQQHASTKAPHKKREVSDSFSSTDSRRLPRSERIPRGQRSLSELSKRDICKMEEFSKQLCSMRNIANRVLQEYSESKITEDLISRLLNNPRVALPSAGPRSTASTASIPPYVPDLEDKLGYVNPHKLPFRVMLWRRAGEQLNKGLFDSGDDYLQKKRAQAYEKGLAMFKKEFRSYANKDHW
ncbi:hypothetical protein EON64_15880, partial [archaeon]